MKLSIREALGLEDAQPGVEINFNIDTNDDGVPLTGEDKDGEQTVEAAKVEAITEDAEADKAENDIAELEEAQEALESMKLVLTEARTISVEDFQLAKLVLSNITGQKQIIDNITMEADLTNPIHNRVLALELTELSLNTVATVSQEGIGNVFNKVKEAIAKFINLEKVVVKRANAMLSLAETRSGEHSTSATIPVNVKRGLNSIYLAHTEYENEKQIMTEMAKFVKFYKSIKVPSLDGVDMTNILNTLFNLSDKEWERITTKHGTALRYSFFGVHVDRALYLDVELDAVNKSVDSLPVLTPNNVVEVLKQVIELSSCTPVLKQIVDELDLPREKDTHRDKLGNVTTTTRGDRNGDIAREIAFCIKYLIKHRTKLMDELVNYCGMCIQDRGVDSPSGNN